MSKMKDFWQQQLSQQRAWIESCGGSLAGYVARYGDPGVPTAKGKPMYGNGGTAIYNADLAALRRIEEKLSRFRT